MVPTVLLFAASPLTAEERGTARASPLTEHPTADEPDGAQWGLGGAPMAPFARAYVSAGRVFVRWSPQAPAVPLVGLPPITRPLGLRGVFLSPRRLLIELADGHRWIAVATRASVEPWTESGGEAPGERAALADFVDQEPEVGAREQRTPAPTESAPWASLRRFHRPDPRPAFISPAPGGTGGAGPVLHAQPAPRTPWRARWRDLGLTVSLWIHTHTRARAGVRDGSALPHHRLREVAAGITLRGRWRPLGPTLTR